MFDIISAKYNRDEQFLQRTHDLNLLLRIIAPEVAGGIYDIPENSGHPPLVPFGQETTGSGRYIKIENRRPNIPEGTSTLRAQVVRQGQMLFGDDAFPSVSTSDQTVRVVLEGWIDQAQIADKMRASVLLGSVGSVALHLKALADINDPHRVYVDVHTTSFLNPTFKAYRPDELESMEEKYKIDGQSLRLDGYAIPEADDAAIFWVMRQWTETEEIWYQPWKDVDEVRAKNRGETFTPVRDDESSTVHNLGFCPWIWIKNLPLGRGVDGSSQFRAAIDHAINLDYLESQIARAVKYTMDPTLVIQQDPSTPDDEEEGGDELAKSPSTILVIGTDGKAYYLEISGVGIEKARQVAADLRKAIIEIMHGDRVDPEKVTQGHQGAKSLAMLNQPLIGLCDQLKVSYGSAMKQMLRMFIRIGATRDIEVNDITYAAASLKPVPDLHLDFGNYYTDTPAELFAQAQADKQNIENGSLSIERAISKHAKDYNIKDVPAERLKIEEDQKATDARAIRLAGAMAQVKVSEDI